MKRFKLNKNMAIFALGMSITAASLSACRKVELAPNEEYDIVQNDDSNLENGLTQKLSVPGENFEIVTKYSIDDESKRAWRVTSDKFLYMDFYTEGLDKDTKVYIDNIHIDTSIKSKYACMDGILQDSMDDRVHNSLIMGFPLSDDVHYYGVNAIEGCNQTFISGTAFGANGYYNSQITERRFTEADYARFGVYANKISVVIDLLVKDKNDQDYRNISVHTDFLVNITETEIEVGNIEPTSNKEKVKK